jgi:excisionase family DNA binding protein
VNTAIEPAYVTVQEACAFLRTSRSFLYKLIRLGEIDTIKRGVRRLVVLHSLREYAERERVERSA